MVTVLRSESPSGKCAKLHTLAASNNRDHLTRSLYYCLFAPHNLTFNAMPAGRCNNISSFSQWTALIARSFCEGCTSHDLHILATAAFCCDRKAQAANAQSFTLWQQATMEITQQDHSIIACSHHIYMGVVLRAHAVRGESHIQRNASGEVATMETIFHERKPMDAVWAKKSSVQMSRSDPMHRFTFSHKSMSIQFNFR